MSVSSINIYNQNTTSGTPQDKSGYGDRDLWIPADRAYSEWHASRSKGGIQDLADKYGLTVADASSGMLPWEGGKTLVGDSRGAGPSRDEIVNANIRDMVMKEAEVKPEDRGKVAFGNRSAGVYTGKMSDGKLLNEYSGHMIDTVYEDLDGWLARREHSLREEYANHVAQAIFAEASHSVSRMLMDPYIKSAKSAIEHLKFKNSVGKPLREATSDPGGTVVVAPSDLATDGNVRTPAGTPEVVKPTAPGGTHDAVQPSSPTSASGQTPEAPMTPPESRGPSDVVEPPVDTASPERVPAGATAPKSPAEAGEGSEPTTSGILSSRVVVSPGPVLSGRTVSYTGEAGDRYDPEKYYMGHSPLFIRKGPSSPVNVDDDPTSPNAYFSAGHWYENREPDITLWDVADDIEPEIVGEFNRVHQDTPLDNRDAEFVKFLYEKSLIGHDDAVAFAKECYMQSRVQYEIISKSSAAKSTPWATEFSAGGSDGRLGDDWKALSIESRTAMENADRVLSDILSSTYTGAGSPPSKIGPKVVYSWNPIALEKNGVIASEASDPTAWKETPETVWAEVTDKDRESVDPETGGMQSDWRFNESGKLVKPVSIFELTSDEQKFAETYRDSQVQSAVDRGDVALANLLVMDAYARAHGRGARQSPEIEALAWQLKRNRDISVAKTTAGDLYYRGEDGVTWKDVYVPTTERMLAKWRDDLDLDTLTSPDDGSVLPPETGESTSDLRQLLLSMFLGKDSLAQRRQILASVNRAVQSEEARRDPKKAHVIQRQAQFLAMLYGLRRETAVYGKTTRYTGRFVLPGKPAPKPDQGRSEDEKAQEVERRITEGSIRKDYYRNHVETNAYGVVPFEHSKYLETYETDKKTGSKVGDRMRAEAAAENARRKRLWRAAPWRVD